LTAWLLAIALCAAPEEPRLAATGFAGVGIDPQIAEFLSERFAQQLREASGLQVTTPKTIAAVLGLERQRQLLGCANDAQSCLAELAGALGVSAIIQGEIARLERSVQINLRIVDAVTAATLFTASRRAPTTDELLDELNEVAVEAGEALRARYLPQGAPSAAVASRRASPLPWVTVGVGAVAVIGGAVALGLGFSRRAEIPQTASLEVSPEKASQIARDASTRANIGTALVAVGAVAVAGGIVWRLAGRSAEVTAMVAPGGGGIAIQAALP
jgi:TolB-like protein